MSKNMKNALKLNGGSFTTLDNSLENIQQKFEETDTNLKNSIDNSKNLPRTNRLESILTENKSKFLSLSIQELKKIVEGSSDDDDDDEYEDSSNENINTSNIIPSESPNAKNFLISPIIEEDELNDSSIIISRDKCELNNDVEHNDSFDLNFSGLNLNTPPVKKNVKRSFNFATPTTINLIPSSSSKLVNNSFKVPSTVSKLSGYKTPLNKIPQVRSSRSAIINRPIFSAVTPEPSKHKSKQLEKLIVENTEYSILNKLGAGGSSEVFRGFNAERKLNVAIKVVKLVDSSTSEGYINEIKLLKSLQNCDKIIKMYNYEITKDKLLVVLELGGDDFNTILKKHSVTHSHLPIHMVYFYWVEMLLAVKQMHSMGVIHSDLKPANFLRVNEELKLIDFGIASKVQDNMTSVFKFKQEGSCNYMSPEALSHQNYGNNTQSPNGQPKFQLHFKSDVWSLGCILYQLVYSKTPFQHISQLFAKLSAIIDPKFKISYPEAKWVSPKLIKTIKQCLKHDVKSRPSVDELLEEYLKVLCTI